jgi:hypothetical protein
MSSYSAQQWQKIYNASIYDVKPLRWNGERKQAWKEDLMGIIIDMHIEQQGIRQELPIFESRKKSNKC